VELLDLYSSPSIISLNLGCLHPVACEIKVRVFSVYATLIS
jgi:hypothetical protein